ncbi:DMT family transporter [Herbiconiux ginsengi]|uniref:Drug/metabolite transporter, DME family n=1 Tax=Herbiconiux ginsengi TaxID=381665 RepID=A0A1H3TPP3_9MICO|nr:EamA family transporter [Herbiconiux ginsengi]SDZ52263.1 drug/metabolite transporter, DME family [Herbiconiux ginsengi]
MLPYLAVLLAAVCFGTTGTAQAFGPSDASSVSIGAARILIGGAVLAAVALLLRMRGRARAGSPAPAIPGPGGRRTPSWLLLLIGAAGVLAYQPAFFLGTSQNGVAVGTVVALGSAPIITGLLDWALHRRFPGAIWLVATLVATLGVVLISGLIGIGSGTGAGGGGGSGTGGAGAPISFSGLLASVGAGASYAVYTLASKALLERGWTPSSTMGSVFGLAAAFSIPLLLTTDIRWLATAPGLAMALWLGLVTTAVAYLLFGWGLGRLRASTVSTLTLAEPLTATLLGTLVLGEVLSGVAVAGLIVLAAGLVILAVPWRGRRSPAPAVSPSS